ncbi:MAG TPA: DUF3800 domain-containing protein [Nitrospirota bacterium]|nr:DUF3800 domain-containing protein [Nitrospirota bacterium]
MLFHFYCDESYDGNARKPNIFTISGFFSDQSTWTKIDKNWNEINHRYGVSRFHATELNGAKGEYSKWSKPRRARYSAELLTAVNCQKTRMRAYNCGMRAAEYRTIINEAGCIKLGHPWVACFKSCIAMIAKDMEDLPVNDSFSVFVERGSGFDIQAVKIFGELKKNPAFAYRHRLKTCTPAEPKQLIGLQVADLMAYEYFKRLQDKENKDMRIPLTLIREHNGYEEGFFGNKTLKNMKNDIESAPCGPDQLVIIPKLS